MAVPPLVHYTTVAEYKDHYNRVYCQKPIAAFDGYFVRFRKGQFNHCFFESTLRNNTKDQFSQLRAERIDWIKVALQDASADLFIGWDSKKKCYDRSRRVAVILQNYVVVVRIVGTDRADFVTAFVADTKSTIDRIRNGPRWQNPSK